MHSTSFLFSFLSIMLFDSLYSFFLYFHCFAHILMSLMESRLTYAAFVSVKKKHPHLHLIPHPSFFPRKEGSSLIGRGHLVSLAALPPPSLAKMHAPFNMAVDLLLVFSQPHCGIVSIAHGSGLTGLCWCTGVVIFK